MSIDEIVSILSEWETNPKDTSREREVSIETNLTITRLTIPSNASLIETKSSNDSEVGTS